MTSLYTSATFVDELGVDSLGAPSSSTATLICLVEGEGAKGGKGDKVRIGLIAAMPSTGEIVWDGTFSRVRELSERLKRVLIAGCVVIRRVRGWINEIWYAFDFSTVVEKLGN